MSMSVNLVYLARAEAHTVDPGPRSKPFGVVTLGDGEGSEVKLFTTPEAARAIADAVNASLASTKVEEAA